MERYVEENGDHYALNIDLSCNSYVTDSGVSSHLVPFLQKWPGVPEKKDLAIARWRPRGGMKWMNSGFVRRQLAAAEARLSEVEAL